MFCNSIVISWRFWKEDKVNNLNWKSACPSVSQFVGKSVSQPVNQIHRRKVISSVDQSFSLLNDHSLYGCLPLSSWLHLELGFRISTTMISQYCKAGNSFNERKITLIRNEPSKISLWYNSLAALVLGNFVLKAGNWCRSIKRTPNNKKSLVASFVTRTEAFRVGGGGCIKNSLIDHAWKRG